MQQIKKKKISGFTPIYSSGGNHNRIFTNLTTEWLYVTEMNNRQTLEIQISSHILPNILCFKQTLDTTFFRQESESYTHKFCQQWEASLIEFLVQKENQNNVTFNEEWVNNLILSPSFD